MSKPEILILDEATSSVDTRLEKHIQDTMSELTSHSTSLIIAHRLATVKNCDVIIVMDNGEIAEKGTHEELLAKKGRYYELWEMQQGNFKVIDKSDKEEITVKVEEDEEGIMSYT